jgi:uncharacterized membrane protein YhaH (DUF805 family)
VYLDRGYFWALFQLPPNIYFQEKMNSPKRNQFLILLAVAMGIVAFIISLVVVLCAKRKDVKTE